MINLITRGKEGLEWAEVSRDCKQDAIDMYLEAVDQEKAWAEFLFKEGSLIGLNAPILQEYVEYIASQRMKSIRLEPLWPKAEYKIHWMDHWISSATVQVAPQETEITSYITGYDPAVKDSVWK